MSVIAGATQDLPRDVYPFNVVIALESLPANGTFSLFTDPTIKRICSGRLSAEFIGPLTVSVTGLVFGTAAPPFANGWIAMRQDQDDITVKYLWTASLPGAVPLSLSPTGVTQSLLEFAPGCHRNVLLNPVVGKDPMVVYSLTGSNVSKAAIVVSGKLHLSGMGQVDF